MGGIVDLYIMMGPDPNTVTQQYHKVVGMPVLTPQWALGWHQCRWGYMNIKELETVVQNFTDFGLPLDT